MGVLQRSQPEGQGQGAAAVCFGKYRVRPWPNFHLRRILWCLYAPGCVRLLCWVSDSSFPQGFPLIIFLALSGGEAHRRQGVQWLSFVLIVDKYDRKHIFIF
ncbi:hypothetical protein [Neisseria shayeganii]|uniref:Uncharacterized protein n=1 Tax=Neisseria shayeganii TaxID=607712 RepID=A0A7D7NCE9_9NEIS|nr:hypothetical protein [Neisseria shayeganii]QMT40798.1 hypothetical protein H3L94_01700 [Neisseria shayeganii]